MTDSAKPAQNKLDTRALRRTPGFMIRLVQLKFFDGFYEVFGDLGLSPAKYAVLTLVRDNPGVPPSSLAALLRLRLPNLTKLLNELEAAGLLTRKRSKTDRRAVALFLTAQGEDVIQRAFALTEPYNRQMLAPLDANERSVLTQLLNRIVAM